MATLPTSLALTTIADGAQAVAADHRNNFAAVQAEANALLTILGAGTAGDVFTGVGSTVAYAKPPGYEYAYNEFTAVVSPVATTEATANTVVTASAVTFNGTDVALIEFFCPAARPAIGAGNTLSVYLYDGTSIGFLGQLFASGASDPSAPLRLTRRLTPSAGSHTYSVRASVNTGTGNVGAGAGGVGVFVPGFIRITRAA